MSLLGSVPGGYGLLRLRGLARGLLWAWLLPSLLAGMALLIQNILNTQSWGDGALMLWAGSYLVLISPALSWLGLILAAPIIAVLMNRGWFGWLPAPLLGLALGAGIGQIFSFPWAGAFGAVQLLLLRGLLGQICPRAFAAAD